MLETTKQLQEMLELWSVRRVNEQQVSDVYVRVGTTFNETVTAFASIAIDLRYVHPSAPQCLVQLRNAIESRPVCPETLTAQGWIHDTMMLI